MDEDQILQSIIADPDVVDPTIDVSKLRQTTPTSSRLLGNVSGIEGLRFDPTRTDYIRDLYSVYGGGLPTIDVAPVVDTTTPTVDTTTPVVDTSGTDQVTGGGGTTPTNTDFEQGLIDQGIGVQASPGDPVGAAFEEQLTQEAIDDLANYPITQPSFDDQFQDIEDIQQTYGTPIDIGFGEGQVDPGLAAGLEGPIIDTSPVTPTITAPSGDVFAVDDPLAEEKIDFTPETQGLVDQAFSKIGSTASDIMNDLSQIPGAIADFANQTVDIAGQKIDVAGTLFRAGINRIVGGPISLVFDAVSNIQPSVSQIEYESYDQGQKNAIDNAYGPGGVMEGYNAVSAFGKGPKETVQERLETRTSNGIFDDTTDKLNDLSEKLGGTRIDPPAYDFDDTSKTTTTPGGDTVDVETGNITDTTGTTVGNVFDEVALTGLPEPEPEVTSDQGFQDINFGEPEITADEGFQNITSPEPSPTPTGGGGQDASQSDFGSGPPSGPGEASADAGFAGEGSGAQGPAGGASNAAAAAAQDAARGSYGGPPSQSGGGGGGGSSGGGGKIVCTMMNESYGFGSFRNKIWLRHSKNLAPEYQKGYHKIFLPLVKLSKNNKVLKIMLEHIAVHRTIDIRQESRGKVHLLGRVYRKILEPICYLVGKYAK